MTFEELQSKITPGDAVSRDVSPNRGRSVAEVDARPEIHCSQDAWRRREGIVPETQVRLRRVAHMRYQHTNLEEITKFLRDFGMSVAKKTDSQRWYMGYGTDRYVYYAVKGDEKKFLGGTFEVDSYAELEKAEKIPSAGKIQEMQDAPGGGYLLTLTDPEGFPINLMYGQTPKEAGDMPEELELNFESSKPRKARFQRFKPGPAAVHKLGHFGLCVRDFPSQSAWYLKNFNLVPTDFLYVNEGDGNRKDVALFAHIDDGEEFTDHHTFFMSTNATSHVHHCSFEVHDFDTQNLGHEWLAKQGYTNVWGVGRHILGSQLFDYWWDTSGNMIEHYADGDLVNNATPVGWTPAGHESLAVWGPEVPKWFLE